MSQRYFLAVWFLLLQMSLLWNTFMLYTMHVLLHYSLLSKVWGWEKRLRNGGCWFSTVFFSSHSPLCPVHCLTIHSPDAVNHTQTFRYNHLYANYKWISEFASYLTSFEDKAYSYLPIQLHSILQLIHKFLHLGQQSRQILVTSMQEMFTVPVFSNFCLENNGYPVYIFTSSL